jgi:hypothetical protein
VSDDDTPLPLTTAEQVSITAFGVVLVVVAANWYLEWNLFAPHDGRAFGATMMAGLAMMRYAQDRYASPVAFTVRLNLRYLLFGALAAALFIVMTFLTPLL